ncbi:MAG TPA: glycosyl hydrolase family 18 protein [Acidobacteriaceae bacterium]|nr:glycosyl hydrolase family 18 protein [Acidobacteriaceae bacterium]
MRRARFPLVVLLVLSGGLAFGQGTAPTFRYNPGHGLVTLPGRDPAQSGTEAGTTVIPTVLVPVRLEFDTRQTSGKPFTLDAAGDVPRVLQSPIFAKAAFGSQGTTQYVDAMLRATVVPGVAETAAGWHTLLGRPEVRPVTVKIPPGYGYVLTSKRTGTAMGMADQEYVQRAIFQQIAREGGKLVIAVTRNTGFYTYGDATVCCTFGTHGVDEVTGNSFVLASYIGAAPPLVTERDVQPLTEQLAEWVNDPLHDPLFHMAFRKPLPPEENLVPAWRWPAVEGVERRGCGGDSPATRYVLQDPVDTNERSDLPAGPTEEVRAGGATWHVADVALLSWYTGGAGGYSFPDTHLLQAAADHCPAPHLPSSQRANEPAPPPAVAAVPSEGTTNGHELIGYWTGSGPGGTLLRLRDISPQWDVILVAFANVNHLAPEGTMQMHVRPGRPARPGFPAEPPMDLGQMKEDITWLKSRGKKVLISLGGGGEYFTLAQKASIPTFVNSITQIVEEYGFDGIDLDFESPSLVLDPGDRDFRHPTTASVVNLIEALHQLRAHFGPKFMLTLVPEGTQIPGGYAGYGGQFGSYLPLLWGVRDMLSFIDVQDYNTPPFQGLDGEVYQMGSVNYDAAMTELLLHGFPVSGRDFFPPLPADKVAAGFLTGTATPQLVSGAMQFLITGKAPAGVTYKLQQPGGYPGMIGAMFWTIDGDRQENYTFSNLVGPQLHGYPAPAPRQSQEKPRIPPR